MQLSRHRCLELSVAGEFLIRNVAIVDVEAGVLRDRQNVFIRRGLIEAVSSTEASRTNASRIAVDGTGLYLMPGLWDMHTHSTKLSSQYQHPLFIANGVTGVREMWGCMSEPDSFFACIDDRQRWNRRLVDHSGLSPRYIGQSSYQINGGSEVPEGFPAFFRARNAQEARQLVNYYADVGVDSLKTYTDLLPESYKAMAEESRSRGLSLAGHRPVRVSLEEMVAAGQDSVEHARLFLLECYADAAGFRVLPDPISAYTTELRTRLIDEQDDGRCRALMDAMAASNTWWTPTLQTLRVGAFAGDPHFRKDARLKYVPFLFKKLMWVPGAGCRASGGQCN